jgi:N6-adenosine-specific RNA methylase IME4
MTLKSLRFNEELFELLKGTEYEALKRDVKKNGIKTELHVLPDGTVICGNQRLRVARELNIPDDKIPIKIISHLKNDKEIKEYIIKDNLLRRHLKPEQRAFLINELSKLYETGSGRKPANIADYKDVCDKTAEETGDSPRTVRNYRAYVKAVKKNPKYKGKRISAVLRDLKLETIREQTKDLKPIKGKFDVIVIDPPWEMEGEYTQEGRRGIPPYPVMTLDEIKNIKLPASDDCILWLWTTNRKMKYIFGILEAWEFEERNILTWVKDTFGVGDWLRNQTEHCILAIKGKPKFDGRASTTVLLAKRTKHSEKPEEFYSMVEKTCFGSKLDYFARKQRKGWKCYGNEV